MRYYLQTQAPAGNWTDHLGSDSLETCQQHALYLVNKQDYPANQVRVVERVDTTVWTPTKRAPRQSASRKLAERASAELTGNEVKALEAIVKSEYQDGGDPVGHDVWTKYVNPFTTKTTQSGVYASLSKKGFIQVGFLEDGQGRNRMGTVCITKAGLAALQRATSK